MATKNIWRILQLEGERDHYEVEVAELEAENARLREALRIAVGTAQHLDDCDSWYMDEGQENGPVRQRFEKAVAVLQEHGERLDT